LHFNLLTVFFIDGAGCSYYLNANVLANELKGMAFAAVIRCYIWATYSVTVRKKTKEIYD